MKINCKKSKITHDKFRPAILNEGHRKSIYNIYKDDEILDKYISNYKESALNHLPFDDVQQTGNYTHMDPNDSKIYEKKYNNSKIDGGWKRGGLYNLTDLIGTSKEDKLYKIPEITNLRKFKVDRDNNIYTSNVIVPDANLVDNSSVRDTPLYSYATGKVSEFKFFKNDKGDKQMYQGGVHKDRKYRVHNNIMGYSNNRVDNIYANPDAREHASSSAYFVPNINRSMTFIQIR